MNPDKIMCNCKKVTKQDILKAMAQGASSFSDVKKATGAGSKCGDCEKDIKRFIKQHKEENNAG